MVGHSVICSLCLEVWGSFVVRGFAYKGQNQNPVRLGIHKLFKARQHTHCPETALVCGPDADTAQSDIYTDPLGRIKVQFPWDGYGAKNHNSSCWLRVSGVWAGNQLGAMRVQGQSLTCLNQNFVKSWDSAQTTRLAWPAGSLQKARAAIVPPAVGAHRTQIVRTQPEEGDATILKTYVQACSNACNYIFIENQYFQLAEWVQFIKQVRQDTLDKLRKAGGSKEKLPPLHLMVISPQAERNEMVPRTYDALAQMGQATSVKGYHRQVEQVQGGKAVTDNEGKSIQAKGMSWDTVTHPVHSALDDNRMEMLRRSAQISQSQIKKELDRLNIKTLAGMLMSYDHNDEARHLQINARDNKAQDAQAVQERAEHKQQNAHVKDALAKDEIEGDYYEYHIRPPRYREIYIHSKLMLIDDSFITLGSANLNTRSMVVDSEINIASAEYKLASGARQRVWANLAGPDLNGGDGTLATVQEQFKRWADRMKDNAKKRVDGNTAQAPVNDSFIHTHDDPRDAPLVRLA
jgi:phosphatidylserine/phosphatidylglycerophosphate/cardiolipin synthase-like enzyme